MRQAKNMMVATLLSVGSPMLLMGDELLRTQRGNNNGYCQDNATCWMNWLPNARSQEMFRFMKELIQYRKHLFQRPEQESMPLSLTEILRHSEICWHGVNAGQPDFSSHSPRHRHVGAVERNQAGALCAVQRLLGTPHL